MTAAIICDQRGRLEMELGRKEGKKEFWVERKTVGKPFVIVATSLVEQDARFVV
jgi:hypothetical protein